MRKKIILSILLASLLLGSCTDADEVSDIASESEISAEEISAQESVDDTSFAQESDEPSQQPEVSEEASIPEVSEEASVSEVSEEVSEPEKAEDTDTPVINVLQTHIVIEKGESFDLLTGVTGVDQTEGDITEKITIDNGKFDSDKAGEYTVMYTLKDSAGNEAESVFRTVRVTSGTIFKAPAVWTNPITDEKLNPEPAPVFGGAWYYKVVSSRDSWVGIEATVTLPEVKITRYKGAFDTSLDIDPWVKNLDNPSVYLGGNAKSESDVGVSLSLVTTNSSGKISTGSVAFRPFWRYITAEDKDVGGYNENGHGGNYSVSANGNNCFGNYHWKYTEYYYLPGDTLRIIVYSPEQNKLQLQIEVIKKSTLPSSVEMREKYGWKDPADFLSPVFSSPGHGGASDAEFKRVNAIDQSGNEGGTAIATETLSKNTVWHETYLYRMIDGQMYRVPMNENRRGTTPAPYAENFTVTYDGVDSNLGGEVVTIHPGYKNGEK